MTDLLKRGSQWLADTVVRGASSLVYYAREGEQPEKLHATIGRSMFKVNIDGIEKIVWTDKDFIFRVADLRKIGIGEPKIGDKINEIVNVAGETISRWYLISPPEGERPFRQADGRDELMRVHTVLDCEEVLG